MPVDKQKLDALIGKFVADLGAAYHAGLVVIGDKLGLYKELAKSPATSDELAKRTGTNERYVREWLSNQAAGGYVEYDAKSKKFSMTEEQVFTFADESSPAFLPGGFQTAIAALRAEPKVAEAFKSGAGVGWHEHDAGLFVGTERFFRPVYAANLLSSWLPALDGVQAKLERGARAADVGCGHGASTLLLAKAFPRSSFTGYDYHAPSIERARKIAAEAGLGDRVRFEVASASNYPGTGFDFVAFFDCLHDMGDPVGASRHVRESLAKDGTWMIVEPFAKDALEDNLHPLGRLFYGASTMICTPASKAQEVGLALGTQAGEARLRDVVTKGGFQRVRRAAETPFNIVLEARP